MTNALGTEKIAREDLAKKIEELEDSANLFNLLTEGSSDLIYVLDIKTEKFTFVSQSVERILGYTKDEALALRPRDVLTPESYRHQIDTFDRGSPLAAEGLQIPRLLELELKHKDGSTIWGEVHARITSDSSGRSANILGICRDITDRKKFEEEQEKIIEILKLIKQARSTMDLTRIVTNYIRSWLGIDAVGIRLRDGDDYPYYETKGFPEQFVAAERYLCARDIDGNLIRDYSGSPVLDCMCGNVILGKFDPSKPFFTEKGSFWTNSTSELLASTTEEDRLTRTRNRCNGEGYESVALVPLRAKGETYGLIQLNGVKKNRFTSRTISLMERIADQLALAVSEQQVNDALSKRERYYRTLMRSLHEGILVIGPDYRIAYINSTVPRTLGMKENDIIGRHCYELLHGFATPCHMHGESCGLRSVFETGETCSQRHEHLTAGGKKALFDIIMAPMKDEDGNITHVVETMRDVTDLFKTQEALREANIIINRSPAVAFLWKNAAGWPVEFVSDNVMELFGYSAREFTSGTVSYARTIHPRDMQRVAEEIKTFSARREREEFTHEPYRIVTKDGEEKWIHDMKFIRRNDEKDITHFEGIALDITERVKGAKEKQNLEAQLRQAYKMEAIGTLAGGIAHDFNNILSPIMIRSEMAMMELPPDSPLLLNLKQIYKAGERAKDLVKHILTFARTREEEQAPLKISLIIKEAIKFLRSSIPTTIDVRCDIRTEQDIVLADPTKVMQIIMNLGTNAAHAMDEKGGMLDVILENEYADSESGYFSQPLKPGCYVKLTVRDTGHGIEPHFIEKIFEPYFTTKETDKGTGMGLALVHGIVKSYGGTIGVQSQVGRGTSFHVYLPQDEENVDVLDTGTDLAKLPTGTEHILIVDDEKAGVDAMQPMLERLGYKVTARTSSVEALEAFRNDPLGYDLVITDQTMPNMTGKELVKKLMLIRSNIPIILCTGFSEKIDEKRAEQMGINAFVMKPIVMQELAGKIREVLDLASSSQPKRNANLFIN